MVKFIEITVQLYRHTDEERFTEIYKDLVNIKKLGVNVYSITCDRHKSTLKAIKKAYPDVIVQRCLVHIKRQLKNYLSTSPKVYLDCIYFRSVSLSICQYWHTH